MNNGNNHPSPIIYFHIGNFTNFPVYILWLYIFCFQICSDLFCPPRHLRLVYLLTWTWKIYSLVTRRRVWPARLHNLSTSWLCTWKPCDDPDMLVEQRYRSAPANPADILICYIGAWEVDSSWRYLLPILSHTNIHIHIMMMMLLYWELIIMIIYKLELLWALLCLCNPLIYVLLVWLRIEKIEWIVIIFFWCVYFLPVQVLIYDFPADYADVFIEQNTLFCSPGGGYTSCPVLFIYLWYRCHTHTETEIESYIVSWSATPS